MVRVPSETITDDAVLIGNIFVSAGSLIEKGDSICEVETSKSIVEIESPSSGYIELKCAEAQEMKNGDILAIIHDTMTFDDETPKEKEIADTAADHETMRPSFSNDAVALIKQFGLSTDIFSNRDFVRKKDVADFVGIDSAPHTMGRTTAERKEKIPANTDIIPLNPLKLAEIKNLRNGQNAITSAFVSKIRLPAFALENKSRAVFKNLRNNLTALIVLRTDRLLKKYKELNAFYHSDSIYFYKEINIGYAIDLDKGLKVVSLGNVEGNTADVINEKLIDFVRRYLQDEISIKDLQGSTFTITDVSSEDVFCFSPMINKFQSAILGISSIDEYDGSLLLSLVFDHRVTEGKKAAQFLKELKKAITEDLSKNSESGRTMDKS